MTGTNQTPIRYKERSSKPQFERKLTKTFNGASSEHQARANLEVEVLHSIILKRPQLWLVVFRPMRRADCDSRCRARRSPVQPSNRRIFRYCFHREPF